MDKILLAQENRWKPSLHSKTHHHVPQWNSMQGTLEPSGRNLQKLFAKLCNRWDDTTLMVESEEELKSLLMKVKESGKADLKLNI